MFSAEPNNLMFIPEIGINHGGSIERAIRMVNEVKEAGLDIVKFQVFKADRFIIDDNLQYHSQSMKEMFKKYELSYDNFREIKKLCDDKSMLFFATPQDIEDVDFLVDELEVKLLKIGSDDLTTIPLLEHVALKKLPTILSCGMATIDEIQDALMIFGFKNVALLHCISLYPPKVDEFNLNKIDVLKRLYPNMSIGFSNHSPGNTSDIMALAKGAVIFEKHVCLDNGPVTPDSELSVRLSDLEDWWRSIYIASLSLGSELLVPTKKELEEMRPLSRRSLVVTKSVKAGDEITKENLGYMRPGTGIPVKYYKNLLGHIYSQDITGMTMLKWAHVEGV